jgi:SAM-dependent methyltransferase
LDAGCGEGYLARELAQRGAQVIGVDLSKELIIAAVRKSQEDDLPISFFIGDIMTLGLRDATFDIILSNHGLNELPDLNSAFREFARVLRPNGSLIALMLHPCFYSSRSSGRLESPTTYFDERRIERHFEVSGLTSPSPALRILRPLEHYASSLRKAGFMIEDLQEPHPPIEVLEKDPWWRENFSTPLFLLLKARKCQ